MLTEVLNEIQSWASGMGGLGLFVIAVLDSSFLPFPQINDALVIVLSTKYPDRMPYYATMATAGSVVGSFMLYAVARRGGEAVIRRRHRSRYLDRALAIYQRYGLVAVLVPALLPPPVPLKVFVLLAGAAAVAPWRFGIAVAIGRGIRYFGEGYLAVVYGERAAELMKTYSIELGVGLAVVAVSVGVAYLIVRQRQAA